MAIITLPFNFVPNTTIVSSQVNADFNTLANYVNSGVGVFSFTGYVVLPGAIYVQWDLLLNVKADGSGATTATFATPFPNNLFQVVAQVSNPFQSSPWALTIQTTAEGSTGFSVNVAGGPAGSTVSVRYMAIGN